MGTEGLLSGARRPPPQASGKRDPKGSVDHSRGRLRALIFSEAWCRLAVSTPPRCPPRVSGIWQQDPQGTGRETGGEEKLACQATNDVPGLVPGGWGGREGRLWGRGPGPNSLCPRPSGARAGPRPEARRLGSTVWTSRSSQVGASGLWGVTLHAAAASQGGELPRCDRPCQMSCRPSTQRALLRPNNP